MTLTLQIENFHVLDDGGPVSILVPESGIRVGRRAGMDWVLPDASRYISGLHFEVGFDGKTWWLTDVSTNGTFLQGHRHRLGAPHALSHGDRFQVGQYIIVAIFDMPQDGAALSPGSLPEHRMDRPVEEIPQEDPWALDGAFPVAPVDPLPVERTGRQPDFSDDFIDLPGPPPPAGPAAAPPATPPAAAVPPPAPLDESAFLRGFCKGAGLAPEAMPQLVPEAFGRALGEALRATASQLMLALQDRAAARHFTRAGERTMRGAADNNPLKFLPDTEQALDALFLNPRAGFLTGAAGFDEALGDLRRHQGALFAALQPALIELLHDLDPGRIEAEARGGGLTGSRKTRAWDAFVQRWDAKTASENGILDEFIRLFAAAYRKADEQGGP
ncbi:type VI secretion system-associated FHA domain protein TagH [Paracoccus siganidrum]|uniref:Type VI secretion system-associated FHA domain protein TagH n=1 Tax=Paracoccus siganidrum TaxID=1276757 RepID=A0A419AC70_9RHOB|nr:type VI secretion system-associated FHA domain protein TagH [Paracoccus siganidrum]RJL21815.1 type VI secretion system-associated FHA domain protein TagH [Paracoccus siganidrum]RMC38174.1 type VI secretion system-associated FHA domain protein TagH [Paracoccus siganidrum]